MPNKSSTPCITFYSKKNSFIHNIYIYATYNIYSHGIGSAIPLTELPLRTLVAVTAELVTA